MNLGTDRAARRAQARVEAAQGVTLADPPRFPADTPLLGVRVDGTAVRVPIGWGIAYSSARGRSALYAREPNGTLHVLVADADGRIRELSGLPDDLVADLARFHFSTST